MSGRNNQPKKDGPSSQPARLDQFGEKMADSGHKNKEDRDDRSC
ncbi:hypothetical protein [Ferviditalea candida]|uniref:Uncharacterized protein n=1 Tax=Ferviditalea candida TaxID=3108399 RepID=A0ABU5ZGR1_9BACL|nr:hypothetical protein [Paenibacillaceae bacterium T2]